MRDGFDAMIFPFFSVPEPLTLSQWADEYAYLSPESAAESGKWRSYPYQAGIMDAITDPAIWKITLQKSARVGYTKILNHATGFFTHHEPCPQLIVQPTVEDAQGHSKDELAPMLRDTPVLAGLVSDPKSKNTDNTILKKSYPGGAMTLIGANSARGFRRITVRVVQFDEVDAYPPTAGREGDQLSLGEKRTDTYWNRKIIIGSTPTVKGASRIETSFNDSDQRFYFVPCPFCGEFQTIDWKRIKWPKGEPGKAFLICEHCAGEIPHTKKRAMIERGHWKATRPEVVGHAGFFIWAGYSYSPNATWGDLAREITEAKHAFARGEDPEKEKLKTFINTRLAELWENKGDRISDEELIARAEQFKAEAPEGVYLITLGVDIQKDRFELEVVGWGLKYESWSLDYIVLKSDDRNWPFDPRKTECESWQKLTEVLDRQYERPDGVRLHVAGVGLDTGYATDAAYAYVKSNKFANLYALKGSSTRGAPLVGRPTTKSKRKGHLGLELYPVGGDTAKDTIAARLQVKEPGPGFCHFPDDRDTHFFDMLTAEERVTLYTKGVPYHAWRLKKGKRRNEALDCRVYAYAALHILNPQWRAIEANMAKRVEKVKAEKEQPETKRPARRRPKKRKGGFVNNWKR